MSVGTHGRMEHKQVDFYLSDEQNMIRKICSWIVDVVVALVFWNTDHGERAVHVSAFKFR